MRAILLLVLTFIMSMASLSASADESSSAAPRRGTKLFFRLLGDQNNAPMIPKSRSAWTQNRQQRTGSTGSSDDGFTEYPFCWGKMDFTFVEQHAVYPRLISGAQADEAIVNTADILMEHVYQPDGCVWGWPARQFVQTFTATQSELVSVTLLVASPPGTFRIALLERGPGGRQIGPLKTFTSGHSITWGTARWTAGQAPLVVGRSYAVRIERIDGARWTPYLHSTGNAYDGGELYADGTPLPASDMALWIVEEPVDLKRALLLGANEEGWVYARERVTFTPRTPNVRLISLTVAPVTEEDMRHGYCDLVLRVRSESGQLVAGPKRCLSVGPKGGSQIGHFLFARDEFLVQPGRNYHLQVALVPHQQAELPADTEMPSLRRDMQARVYGEPHPGAMPNLFNLSITPQSEDGFLHDGRLQIRWSEPFSCPTRIETWGLGENDGKRTDVPAGTNALVIRKFWPGHEYTLRLTSVGPTGLLWRTPLYRLRIPRTNEIPPLKQPEYPQQFATVAAPKQGEAPVYGPLRYFRQVPVVNGDFEEGLAGWDVAGPGKVDVRPSQQQTSVKWGRQMATLIEDAGTDRRQALAEVTLVQQIPVTPGHVYVLSAWANTTAIDATRGNTRVRLFATPTQSDHRGWQHSSQWYWTDGQWMRFQHRWTATAAHETIGLGLFRWWDAGWSGACVDHVTVWDLGPTAVAPSDPAVNNTQTRPAVVLTAHQVEADDKVEARLAAPPGYVITGVGSRAQYDNITTMWLRIQPLLPNGELGPPQQLRAGWEPDAGLEAEVTLPDGYVATGFGAAVAPEWDVKRFRVWGRPLAANGTLGEEREFRGGIDRVSGVEKQVRLGRGRILTAAGLNCMRNDINGIFATSAVVRQTASSRSK